MDIQIPKRTQFNKLIWLFPPLYLIHDLEEILTVESFLLTHSDRIPVQLTTLEFIVAFFLLWGVAVIGCYFVSKQKRFLGMEATTFFSFLVPGILLANGIGHLFQWFFFQEYVPGIITSILIIYPYSFVVLKYLLKEQLLTMKRFLVFLVLGVILQAPLAASALLISKALL